jgi:hypothetical protein
VTNPLSRKQVLQLAAEAQVDPRTIENIYKGEPSKGLVRSRVEEAAKKLKFVAPPTAV